MTLPVALDPVDAVQVGLHQLLTGDEILMQALAGEGVYDEVPEGASLDYVVIRDLLSIPDGAHDTHGRQVTATIHTWTLARSNRPGSDIGTRLVALLDHQHAALDALVPGHAVWRIAHEFHQSLPDPNREIRHRIDRFRIYVHQEEV